MADSYDFIVVGGMFVSSLLARLTADTLIVQEEHPAALWPVE